MSDEKEKGTGLVDKEDDGSAVLPDDVYTIDDEVSCTRTYTDEGGSCVVERIDESGVLHISFRVFEGDDEDDGEEGLDGRLPKGEQI